MRNKQIKNVLALIFSLSMLFSTVGTKTLSIRALENDTNVTTVVEANKKVELGENNNVFMIISITVVIASMTLLLKAKKKYN